MKTVQDVLQLSTDYLKKKGMENPRRQAEELLCDVLGINRLHLYMDFERPIEEKELDTCRSWLSRRGNGEPLAYIRGFVEFYDCRLSVSPDVLIPRQETEILVDKIVQSLKKEELQGKTLWDLCCGSGCIGIAIKKALPALTVIVSDLSPPAVQLAKKNATDLQVDVAVLEGDLFAPFKGMTTDFIVCNPPYVSKAEFSQLDREVRDQEPTLALVGGVEGLDFYDRIAREMKGYLKPKGKAWFEIGAEQGKAVDQLFTQQGWAHCQVEKDWAGHDRFFSLENE